jgi:hypothetical protein
MRSFLIEKIVDSLEFSSVSLVKEMPQDTAKPSSSEKTALAIRARGHTLDFEI